MEPEIVRPYGGGPVRPAGREARPIRRPPPEPGAVAWIVAGLLFLATLFTTTTLGAIWFLATRTDETTTLFLFLGPRAVSEVWSDPRLLGLGLAFSLPTLFILLSHELGHYLICRRYRLPATPPFFLPVPVGLGTFGAFIRIRSAIRTKAQLLDVGVGGPIAGFVALLPFLVLGVARSSVEPVAEVGLESARAFLLLPGTSPAIALTSRLFHGPMPPDSALVLHPFGLAAWVGLLVTAFNLIPLGQLDGGHILYAATGRLQRRLAAPLWAALLAAGLLFWHGWLVWCAFTLAFGLHHPPVVDERRPLDRRRRILALVAAAIFVLSLMPVPIRSVPVP